MLKYEVTLKNGKIIKISSEKFLIVKDVLAMETKPEFIELDPLTIISTSMIASIEREDDGSLE